MNPLISIVKRIHPRLGWNLEYRSGHWDDCLKGCPVSLAQVLKYDPRSIVDLGCGNGVFAEALFDAGWRGNFTGVDISSAAVEMAKARAPQAGFVVDDIAKFTLPTDCLVMIESVYYVSVESAKTIIQSYPCQHTVVRICDTNRHAEHAGLLLDNGFTCHRLNEKGAMYYR